jgi:hypothetical protein
MRTISTANSRAILAETAGSLTSCRSSCALAGQVKNHEAEPAVGHICSCTRRAGSIENHRERAAFGSPFSQTLLEKLIRYYQEVPAGHTLH